MHAFIGRTLTVQRLFNLVFLLVASAEVALLQETDRHGSFKGNLEEVCLLETFQPRCWKNEVVVMEEAIYGRRRVGRCLGQKEASSYQGPMYFGCSTNVRHILDEKCSGKKECDVRIPDPQLEQTMPCLEGLKMFLEVSYSCVPVVEEDRSCVVTLTSSALHIASSSSRQSNINCGTKTQPWLLEAPAGQRINISLLDFTDSQHLTRSTSHSSSTSDSCVQQQKHHYGYIIDKSSVNKKNVSVCGADSNRQTHVYLSTSNQLQLVLTTHEQRDTNFLFRVEGVGCTNLIPPEDTWLKRDDDKITIGCYTSRQTWQLRCVDGRWTGVVSNCTMSKHLQPSPEDATNKDATFLEDYAAAIIVGICFTGLAICLIIVCCGVICLRRYYHLHHMDSLEKSGIKYNYIQPDDLNQHNVIMSTAGQINLHNNRPLSQQQPAAQPQYSVFVGTNDDRRDVIQTGDVTTMSTRPYYVLDREAVSRENDVTLFT